MLKTKAEKERGYSDKTFSIRKEVESKMNRTIKCICNIATPDTSGFRCLTCGGQLIRRGGMS